MLSQPYRFHGRGSLAFVFRKGHANRGYLMMVRVARNDRRQQPRVAVIVSKKIARRAHDRNRIRRRLYEIIRGYLPEISQAYDIAVMVTNKEIGHATSQQLHDESRRLLQNARVLPAGKQN